MLAEAEALADRFHERADERARYLSATQPPSVEVRDRDADSLAELADLLVGTIRAMPSHRP
jgi:uncharacterized alpha-E superfamily protein